MQSESKTACSVAYEPKYLVVSILPHGTKVLAILSLFRQNWLTWSCESMICKRRHALGFRIRVRIQVQVSLQFTQTKKKSLIQLARGSTETITTLIHWTKPCPLQMSLSSEKVVHFEPVKTISNKCFSKGKRAPAMLLPHEAKQTLPTYFVLNAMATTAYHNQLIRDLDKKCTILPLYGSQGRHQQEGQWCPAPPFKIGAPHFTFGSPVAAYIQYCILKMGPSLLVFGPSFWVLALPAATSWRWA